MSHFRMDTEAPNDKRRIASNLRVMALEDYIISLFNKDNEIDREKVCATNILTYRRLKAIIACPNQVIFGYAPSTRDEQFYEGCCKQKPGLEAFASAAQLISELDDRHLEHGYPMADEVAEAVRKAARYILEGIVR